MKFCSALCSVIVGFLVLTDAENIQLDGRIIGGTNASIENFPYQISLRRSSSHICGGSIFHNYFILTAAHCIGTFPASYFSIRAGSHTVNNNGNVIQIQSVHVHSQYNSDTMDNDIAILRLKTPLQFSASVLPIALPSQGETLKDGITSVVSGWGLTEESGTQIALTLQTVDVPIVSRAVCQKKYPEETITNNMICAGLIGTGGKDACQGDSGGPLRASGKLMGVTSWGYGCARPHYPGVYTNVANYRNWIRAITGY